MTRRLTYLGGPLDGDIVDDQGPEIRMLAAPPLAYYVAGGSPEVRPLSILHFTARQDYDGRWFYVLRPQTKGKP